jgi:hypothetical protein
MKYDDMIAAANNGKLTEFDKEFKSAMSEIMSSKLNSMKADIASTVRIDGEEELEDSSND